MFLLNGKRFQSMEALINFKLFTTLATNRKKLEEYGYPKY